MEREIGTVYISATEYRQLVEEAGQCDLYAAKAEELENQVKEQQAKLEEYAVVDMWFMATPWNQEAFKRWSAEQGYDEQAIEIDRLNGENEELRRGMDELGAQVEYWRLKAGAEE